MYPICKDLTIGAVKDWLSKAKVKAASEKSTLNILFRCWLRQFVKKGNTENEIGAVMKSMDYAYPGKKFTRDEFNIR